MLSDRTVHFADEVLDLIDDLVPGVKTRIIAEQLGFGSIASRIFEW
jgi:hypothetical protein